MSPTNEPTITYVITIEDSNNNGFYLFRVNGIQNYWNSEWEARNAFEDLYNDTLVARRHMLSDGFRLLLLVKVCTQQGLISGQEIIDFYDGRDDNDYESRESDFLGHSTVHQVPFGPVAMVSMPIEEADEIERWRTDGYFE